MALNSSSVVSSAMEKLVDKGFITDNKHSKQNVMVEAIVEAVIEAILNDAQVIDPGGVGSGLWSIK